MYEAGSRNQEMTKGELLRQFLNDRGVQVNPARLGWQKVSCFGAGHARGDRNPSASVNLGTGYYHCFACGLAGDVYALLQEVEGIPFKEAKKRIGTVRQNTEPTWL